MESCCVHEEGSFRTGSRAGARSRPAAGECCWNARLYRGSANVKWWWFAAGAAMLSQEFRQAERKAAAEVLRERNVVPVGQASILER